MIQKKNITEADLDNLQVWYLSFFDYYWVLITLLVDQDKVLCWIDLPGLDW